MKSKVKGSEKTLNNWIENVFHFGDKLKVPRLLFSFVFITIPACLLFTPFILGRIDAISEFTPRMWIGIISAGVWVWSGPYFINLYCVKMSKLFDSIKKDKIMSEYYIRMISDRVTKKFLVPSIGGIVFMVGILATAVYDSTYLTRFDINGFSDVYFYIFLIVLAYLLYIASIGFNGVFVVVKLVSTLIKDDILHIDYFHIDKAGGIKCIKQFILFTTKMFLSGILFVPILLDYIIYTNFMWAKVLLYGAIFAYSICIFLSFFIPIKRLYLYADKKKNEYLEDLSYKYKLLMNSCLSEGCQCTTEEELSTLNIYYFIKRVDETTIYNANSGTWFEIIAFLCIPIFCFFANSQDIIKISTEIISYFK